MRIDQKTEELCREIKRSNLCVKEPEVCELCDGDGYIEIMGDGANFEYDVIGTKPCPECFESYDD